ncbi:MAG: hypothetical protein KGL39_58265 [Patescibacteria group bacterium]|nr:hypothetical protein [Patescibacteria group bacterium]
MTDHPTAEPEIVELEPCPSCGALPCDWVNNPHIHASNLASNHFASAGNMVPKAVSGGVDRVLDVAMLRLKNAEDYSEAAHIAISADVRLIRELAALITSLASEKADLERQVEDMRLDIDAQEALQVSAYRAGAKFGWNCCDAGDEKRYQLTMEGTEHIAELKRIRKARAQLARKEGA